jgi:hypothetical protein
MILSLIWLTVSIPFIYSSQQQLAQNVAFHVDDPALGGSDEETTNPLSNTTEEKNPNSNSFSEEYLHDNHTSDGFFMTALLIHNCENVAEYVAFHGELLVPPPDQA